MRPRAPTSWEEYCHAFTFLFSAPNRNSVLAREIATIKQAEGQSVDTYSLKVTQARTRLLAEAARSAPAHLSPHEHAWDVFLTATFENGLLPGIRLESVREDPPNSFQEARIRAKKHDANNLRCFHPHPSYCICCSVFLRDGAPHGSPRPRGRRPLARHS